MNTLNSFLSSTLKPLALVLLAAGLIACQVEPSAQTEQPSTSTDKLAGNIDKPAASTDTPIAKVVKESVQPVDSSKYTILESPINVSTGDKIEVTELFWYGCSHCFALEPHIENWKKSMPDNAEFVKVPAIFSSRWEFHAKAYYTMEALGVLDRTNDAFFHQIHVMKKPMNTLAALVSFLKQFGKTEEEVSSAFNSFAVDSKLRNAKRITDKSTARGVPAILVDGKYHTSGTLAGSTEELFKVVNQLVAKAATER